MSILDGMPKTEAELKKVFDIAGAASAHVIQGMELSERQQSIIDLMKEGMSLADILGISKEHRDALLVQGGRFLQLGEIQKARDTLTVLYQMEPMDERVIYALATSFQLEGNFKAAGQLYVHFLALDATNPDGFLRLGECFLGAKEYEDAKGSFEKGFELATRKNDSRRADHARKMLAIVAERASSAA